jgi:hypothetical protein
LGLKVAYIAKITLLVVGAIARQTLSLVTDLFVEQFAVVDFTTAFFTDAIFADQADSALKITGAFVSVDTFARLGVTTFSPLRLAILV